MANNKKSFILYVDLISMVNQLPDDKAGQLFKIILEYVNDNNPIVDDLLLKIAFEPIKAQLKRDLKKYESIREKRSEAGKASAEIRKQNQQVLTSVESVKQCSTNSTVNVNVNDNVTVKKKNIEERKSDFKKSLHPFLDEFGKDILNPFYEYWTEHGLNDRKMRFEKEKSFGIKRRLITWRTNESKFNNEKNRTNNKRGFKSDSSQQAAQAIINSLID